MKLVLRRLFLVYEGASVISSRCSQTYTSPSPCLTLFGIPLWSLHRSPRTAIQVTSLLFLTPLTFHFPPWQPSLHFSSPRVPRLPQVHVGLLWGQRGRWPSCCLTQWRSHMWRWTTCRATTPPPATSDLPLKTWRSMWVRSDAENRLHWHQISCGALWLGIIYPTMVVICFHREGRLRREKERFWEGSGTTSLASRHRPSACLWVSNLLN